MNAKITTLDLHAHFDTTDANMPIETDGRTASVALIFWCDGGNLRLCLGRRAISAHDPWSGDLAFPGGKAEPEDHSLHDVASRETFEEVGLTLPTTALIGRMEKVNANGRKQRKPTTVWPLVYLLESQPPPFSLSEEMSEAYWVSLADLWNRKNWIAFSFPATRAQYPGIHIGNHFLWGFSLRVLMTLGDRLGRSLQPILALEQITHIGDMPPSR